MSAAQTSTSAAQSRASTAASAWTRSMHMAATVRMGGLVRTAMRALASVLLQTMTVPILLLVSSDPVRPSTNACVTSDTPRLTEATHVAGWTSVPRLRVGSMEPATMAWIRTSANVVKGTAVNIAMLTLMSVHHSPVHTAGYAISWLVASTDVLAYQDGAATTASGT